MFWSCSNFLGLDFYYFPCLLEFFINQVEEDVDGVLVIVSIVFEGPSRFKDEALIFRRERELFLWIEFQCGKGRKYFSEEKESLLIADLVREIDGFGERNIYGTFWGEKGVENSWAVLEKSFFDVLGCWLKSDREYYNKIKYEIDHKKNNIIAFLD